MARFIKPTAFAIGMVFILAGGKSIAQDTSAHVLAQPRLEHFQLKTIANWQKSSLSGTDRNAQSTISTYVSNYDRLPDGYRVDQTFVDLDLSGLNIPPSVPKPQMERYTKYLRDKAAIHLNYRTDAKLAYVAFYNLDTVMSDLKSATLTFMETKDENGNLMMGLEGAAKALLPDRNMQISNIYDKSMVIGIPFDVESNTFSLLGESLNMPGKGTLTTWNNTQKIAHVVVTFMPSQSDIHDLLIRSLNATVARSGPKAIPGGDVENVVKNTSMLIKETCSYDIDITTGLATMSECETTSTSDFDLHSQSIPSHHSENTVRLSAHYTLLH